MLVAITDVLLEGGLTVKKCLNKGEGGLKSEDFRGTSFMDGPIYQMLEVLETIQ